MTKPALSLGGSLLLLILPAFFSIELLAVDTPCTDLPPGIVAWWPAQGDARDLIGAHSGQSPSGVGFDAGVVGLAFSFNGTNNYVEVADAPDLRLTNQLTIEFWVKRLRLDPSIAEYIIEKGGDWSAGAQNYAVALHNAQYNYALHFLFADGWRGGGSIADTNWHHCAVVARQGDTDPQLYIDGAQQPITYRQGATTINLYPSTQPLHIGAQLDPNGNYFGRTMVDELSIYRRALSNSEIQAIYAAASAGKCPPAPPACAPPPTGLVSWWPGQYNALDAGGTNNGRLAGNVTYGEGRVGQGFVLDGNADAVVVGNPTNLELQNFTIETWMRRSSPSIVSFGSHTDALLFGYGSGGYGLGLLNDGRLFLTRVDIDNVTIDAGITDTNFHHVAVSKSNDVVVFYIDGTAHPAPSYSTTYTFSTPAAIGARADTMDDSFFGTIDEVSVYNRVLSADEIQAIYAADALGKCRSPIKPFILTQPSNWAAYVGDTFTLSVTASGDGPLTYQWIFNGSNLFGATGAALTLVNVDARNIGNYSVVVSNSADSVTSSNALVTVGPRPPCAPAADGIVSWWQGETNAFDATDNNQGTLVGNTTFGPGRVGQAFRFDGHEDAVRVGNPSNLQLQNFTIETWIKRSDPAVATFGTHTTALFFSYGSGGYGFGMFDDGRLFLTRVDIDNVALSTGLTDTNNFHHVAVTKSNTTVVFYIDGVAFPALSYNDIFSFTTEAGLGARVDTFNDSFFGSIDELAVYNRPLSADEILAIYNADGSGKCKVPRPPFIVAQPASHTNYIGDTASFNVSAIGDAPLTYQWQFQGNDLPGQTGTNLVLVNVQTTNSGSYSVLVSNAVDSVRSSNAVLTVVPRPPCTPVPNGLVSWWRAETNSLDSWGSNDGIRGDFTGPSFSPGKVGNAFNFLSISRVLQISDNLTLELTNALSIEAWINPAFVSLLPNTILAKWNVAISGPIVNQSSYYLGLTNNGSLLFMLSPGGSPLNKTALVTTQRVPTNQWSFVVATYDGAEMQLYINGVLAAQTNYSGGIFPGNDPLDLGAVLQPLFPPISQQWPFRGLLDEISLYDRALAPEEIQAIYNSDVTGKCLSAPVIAKQPQSQAIPLGEDVQFSVSVVGTRPLHYQWRFNGVNLPGATNSNLVLEKIATNRVGNYSVFVSNVVNSTLSSNALLTLLPAPTCVPAPDGMISWWPADGNGIDAAGTNRATVTFPATFTVGKSGLAFAVPNSPRVSTPPVQVLNSASLNFGSNVDFSIETWVKVIPTNTTASLTIVDKRDGLVGYALLLNQGRLACWLGNAPSSTINSTLFTAGGPDLRDGMFHHVALSLARSATNGGHLYVDGQALLTFDPTARRSSLVNTSPFNIGAALPLLLNSNTFLNGWVDELAVYNRALSPDEIASIRQAGAAGKCKIKPFILTQPLSQRVNVGSNVALYVTAGGNPPLRYQWLRNNVAVPGATNSTLTFQAQLALSGNYSVRVTNVFGPTLSSNAVVVVNTAPFAFNLPITLNEDTPTSVTLLGSDPQNDLLTFSLVSLPAHGTLAGVPPNLIYTPATNYNGPDSFNFKANDGLLDSEPATVSLTVLPVNDPPVPVIQVGPLFQLTPDQTNLLVLSLDNTNAHVVLDGSSSYDVENDPLTFSWLEGTNLLGSGMILTNVFPISPHTVTLQVNDGQDTGTATTTFEVISTSDSVRLLFGMIQTSGVASQTARPLEATLKAATIALDNGGVNAAINILQAFQNKVRAQVQPTDPTLAAEWIAAAQKIIDSLTNSP